MFAYLHWLILLFVIHFCFRMFLQDVVQNLWASYSYITKSHFKGEYVLTHNFVGIVHTTTMVTPML